MLLPSLPVRKGFTTTNKRVIRSTAVSMMGITFNIHALCFFAAHGLSGAASTRVGNELGAGRPRLAWLNTQVRVVCGQVGQ
jgi:Na+-driven multidrug efflux pump